MKSNLSKNCVSCGRTIEYRKKWENNWDEIKYCSDRCRRQKKRTNYEDQILALLQSRGIDKTICPSEVLSGADKQNKELMEEVRISARKLVEKGLIVITQKGQVVDPSLAKGAIRLKRLSNNKA